MTIKTSLGSHIWHMTEEASCVFEMVIANESDMRPNSAR